MSTAAGADHMLAHPLPPGSSPQAIRAALLPEEVGNFDREYRREMAVAIETLDLVAEWTSGMHRWSSGCVGSWSN